MGFLDVVRTKIEFFFSFFEERGSGGRYVMSPYGLNTLSNHLVIISFRAKYIAALNRASLIQTPYSKESAVRRLRFFAHVSPSRSRSTKTNKVQANNNSNHNGELMQFRTRLSRTFHFHPFTCAGLRLAALDSIAAAAAGRWPIRPHTINQLRENHRVSRFYFRALHQITSVCFKFKCSTVLLIACVANVCRRSEICLKAN